MNPNVTGVTVDIHGTCSLFIPTTNYYVRVHSTITVPSTKQGGPPKRQKTSVDYLDGDVIAPRLGDEIELEHHETRDKCVIMVMGPLKGSTAAGGENLSTLPATGSPRKDSGSGNMTTSDASIATRNASDNNNNVFVYRSASLRQLTQFREEEEKPRPQPAKMQSRANIALLKDDDDDDDTCDEDDDLLIPPPPTRQLKSASSNKNTASLHTINDNENKSAEPPVLQASVNRIRQRDGEDPSQLGGGPPPPLPYGLNNSNNDDNNNNNLTGASTIEYNASDNNMATQDYRGSKNLMMTCHDNQDGDNDDENAKMGRSIYRVESTLNIKSNSESQQMIKGAVLHIDSQFGAGQVLQSDVGLGGETPTAATPVVANHVGIGNLNRHAVFGPSPQPQQHQQQQRLKARVSASQSTHDSDDENDRNVHTTSTNINNNPPVSSTTTNQLRNFQPFAAAPETQKQQQQHFGATQRDGSATQDDDDDNDVPPPPAVPNGKSGAAPRRLPPPPSNPVPAELQQPPPRNSSSFAAADSSKTGAASVSLPAQNSDSKKQRSDTDDDDVNEKLLFANDYDAANRGKGSSSSSSSSDDGSSRKVTWQFMHNTDADTQDDAAWTSYKPEVSNRIEEAFTRYQAAKRKTKHVIYVQLDQTYQVNLQKKRQQRLDDASKHRPVRRVEK